MTFYQKLKKFIRYGYFPSQYIVFLSVFYKMTWINTFSQLIYIFFWSFQSEEPILKILFWLYVQRKEKLLKKQHREALLLDSYMTADGLSTGRSLRDRKPVTYTFGKSLIAEILDNHFFPFFSWSFPVHFVMFIIYLFLCIVQSLPLPLHIVLCLCWYSIVLIY